MTNPYTISNPAPRYLDPAGVNHLGYVDPVRRVQELRALRNLSSLQPQQMVVAPRQAFGPDTGPSIEAGPEAEGSQWASRSDGAVLVLLIAVLLAAVGIIVGFNLLLRKYWHLAWVRFCGVAVQVYLAAAITAVLALHTGPLAWLLALPVALLAGFLAARFVGNKRSVR